MSDKPALFEYLVEVHVMVKAKSGTQAEALLEGNLNRLRKLGSVETAYVADVRSEDDPDPLYREVNE